MPSLIDIRRRIRSVNNTQQITKAMKMVSAARLRRAQERVLAARPYAQMLREMLANVAAAAAENRSGRRHPLLAVASREPHPGRGDHGGSRTGRSLQRQPSSRLAQQFRRRAPRTPRLSSS